jgi:tRNA(fMet)-specific endonuclease VapC
MLILLDTDICIHLINRRPGFERVLRRLSGRSLGEICISAITVCELRYGVAKSAKSSENTAALEEFLSRFELLDYPVQAGEGYGWVRVELERSGKPIGNNDLLIAAHALAIGARVATANRTEFERVPALKVLDWLS